MNMIIWSRRSFIPNVIVIFTRSEAVALAPKPRVLAGGGAVIGGTPVAGSGGAIPLINCGGQVGSTRKRRWGDLSFTDPSNFVLALQLTYIDCASGAKLCEPHRSLVAPASGATTGCALSFIIAVLACGRSSLTSQSVSRSRDPGDVPGSLNAAGGSTTAPLARGRSNAMRLK